MTFRSSVPFIGFLTVALTLAGCASGGAQSASPGPPEVSVSSSAPAKPTLADVKPCDLLSATERSQVGLAAIGKDKAIGAARACDWTAPGVFGVTVTLDDAAGLADLKVAKKTATPAKVGAHDALRVSDKKAADGTCAVLLGVGEKGSAQVDVGNTNFTDTALACERAGAVAGLIEPKLP
jgi:uncharacterized protein DUF3558